MPIEPTSQQLASALAAAKAANPNAGPTPPPPSPSEPTPDHMVPQVNPNLVPDNPAQAIAMIDVLRQYGLDQTDAEGVLLGKKATRDDYDNMVVAKARLMNDKAWVKRYFDGDVLAMRQMMAINVRLAVGPIEEEGSASV